MKKIVDGILVDMAQDEIEARLLDFENSEADRIKYESMCVRTHRNALLSESDWTQVADAPVDAAKWSAYRQALRDITAQAGFPYSVEWPTKPEGV